MTNRNFHGLSLALGIIVFFVSTGFGQKESNLDDVTYHAPIRYVIVYNEIFDDQRRVEILLDERNFSKSNLEKVFKLIKSRFPMPIDLEIEVHVNHNTIETPEEREMVKDGEDKRFAKYYFMYKSASYSRFDNGREAYIYTTSLSPYREKTVVLVDKR